LADVWSFGNSVGLHKKYVNFPKIELFEVIIIYRILRCPKKGKSITTQAMKIGCLTIM